MSLSRSESHLASPDAASLSAPRHAQDTESITALCVTPSASHLCVFTSSLSLRIYEVPSSPAPQAKPIKPVRVIARAHDAPVHVCKADPTSTYLASGAADGVVKVWDILRGYVTHLFKGHGGVVSALAFNYPFDPAAVVREQKMQLVTASVDTRIRIFDLSAAAARASGGSKPEAVLEGHVSVPRGLDVSQDGRWLVSGGRDSVVLVWDISSTRSAPAPAKKGSKGKGKAADSAPVLVKTIPVLERVEAVGLLHPDEDLAGAPSGPERLRFYTGGEKGAIKIWDAREGTVLFTLGQELEDGAAEEQEEQRQIVDAMYVHARLLATPAPPRSETLTPRTTRTTVTSPQARPSSPCTRTRTSSSTRSRRARSAASSSASTTRSWTPPSSPRTCPSRRPRPR